MATKTESLAKLLSLSSEDSEAMLRAAVECFSDGDFSRAETILVGLMTLDDTDVRPVKLLASCFLLQDRHREAEVVYQKAYEMDADDPYTLVALGEIKLKTLALAEAIPLFEKLFALDKERRHPAANRGRRLVHTYYAQLQQST